MTSLSLKIKAFLLQYRHILPSGQYANVVISCIFGSISIKLCPYHHVRWWRFHFHHQIVAQYSLEANIKIGSFKVCLVSQSMFYDFDINWKGGDNFVYGSRYTESNFLPALYKVSYQTKTFVKAVFHL